MSAQNPTKVDPFAGRAIASGRYRIIERIATGGMGIVYKAEQLPLGRPVALKILEARHSPEIDDSFRQRFFLEAAAAAKLAHPNTIVVYDYGQSEEGIFYIAMEYLKGGTLEHRLKKEGPIEPAAAIHVGVQVCSSLRDAHEQGLVHRDLKPGNIMFAPRGRDNYYVKVLDFGLVKVVSGEEREDLGLTRSGVVMGSPRYMAPEQVRALAVDHRADIYSFGATLYHMLSGAPPFASGKAFDAMTAHVTTPPPPLRQTWPSCPASEQLEAVVMRCLAKSPAARYPSMDELLAALADCPEAGGLVSGAAYLSQGSLPALRQSGEWQQALGSGARPLAQFQESGVTERSASVHMAPAPRPARKGRTMALVGTLLGAVLIAAISALAWPSDPPAEPTARPTPPPVAAPPTQANAVEPVMVRTEPAGATIQYEGRDLGDTPLPLVIPAGERWQVRVTLDGHQTREVTLVAGQPEVTVRLRPNAPAVAPVTASPPAAPASGRRRRAAAARGGGDVDTPDLTNPWDEQ